MRKLSAAQARHWPESPSTPCCCQRDHLSAGARLEPDDSTAPFLRPVSPRSSCPPDPRWRPPPSPQRGRLRRAPHRACTDGSAGGREPRGAPAGGGERAHTHVSPWTTRWLPNGCCFPLSDWLSHEPFTFYPPFSANRLAPFIAWGCGVCELRRVEFSERACVAGVGRLLLVRVGGVGEVLRLRRAGSAGGREGEEEVVPGPGEWRNLTVGGSEVAAAGKWRRRQQHNETRPVVGGSARLSPVRAGRRQRPGHAGPSPPGAAWRQSTGAGARWPELPQPRR